MERRARELGSSISAFLGGSGAPNWATLGIPVIAIAIAVLLFLANDCSTGNRIDREEREAYIDAAIELQSLLDEQVSVTTNFRKDLEAYYWAFAGQESPESLSRFATRANDSQELFMESSRDVVLGQAKLARAGLVAGGTEDILPPLLLESMNILETADIYRRLSTNERIELFASLSDATLDIIDGLLDLEVSYSEWFHSISSFISLELALLD